MFKTATIQLQTQTYLLHFWILQQHY